MRKLFIIVCILSVSSNAFSFQGCIKTTEDGKKHLFRLFYLQAVKTQQALVGSQ